jgi:hypothetical protein
MLTGSCLCGQVAYAADCEIGPIGHCHCESCRKAHGAAFSSIAGIPRARFGWTQGEDLIKAFESSPGKLRWFCSNCGSQMMAERIERDTVMLRLGCLDTPVPGGRQWHIWRSDGASWYDPNAEFDELPEGAPARAR